MKLTQNQENVLRVYELVLMFFTQTTPDQKRTDAAALLILFNQYQEILSLSKYEISEDDLCTAHAQNLRSDEISNDEFDDFTDFMGTIVQCAFVDLFDMLHERAVRKLYKSLRDICLDEGLQVYVEKAMYLEGKKSGPATVTIKVSNLAKFLEALDSTQLEDWVNVWGDKVS